MAWPFPLGGWSSRRGECAAGLGSISGCREEEEGSEDGDSLKRVDSPLAYLGLRQQHSHISRAWRADSSSDTLTRGREEEEEEEDEIKERRVLQVGCSSCCRNGLFPSPRLLFPRVFSWAIGLVCGLSFPLQAATFCVPSCPSPC